jgi:hypothetical protein
MEILMSDQDQSVEQNPGKPNAELTEEEKRIELEKVQKEAAEEREETGGYQ